MDDQVVIPLLGAHKTKLITTAAGLEVSRNDTTIIDANGLALQRHGSISDRGGQLRSAWICGLAPTLRSSDEIDLPALVVYVPDVDTSGSISEEEYRTAVEEITEASMDEAFEDEPVHVDMARRLSRPCYDKPHRCPGWAGGGTRNAKTYRCDDGYVRIRTSDPDDNHPGTHPFRFGHCNTCGVTTWPYAIRWIDPRFVLGWKFRDTLRDLPWRWDDWRYRRSYRRSR